MPETDEEVDFTIPMFLNNYPNLVSEYLKDISRLIDIYPLGMKVKVNMNATYANLFNYVSKERCCYRAQTEIANMYTLEIIPYIYNELLRKADNNTDLYTKAYYYQKAYEIKKYLHKYRCGFADYTCTSPCPDIKRKISLDKRNL